MSKKQSICVIGGGNIGVLLSAELSLKGDFRVTLLTSRPQIWSGEIMVSFSDRPNTIIQNVAIEYVTDDEKSAIGSADIILITTPSHIVPQVMKKIEQYIRPQTIVGVLPGTGGAEYFASNIIGRRHTFFGIQRVHNIARIKTIGKEIVRKSRRDCLNVSIIPRNRAEKVIPLLEKIFCRPCHLVDNYLNITLTPSNAILHTARLYDLFHDQLFYSEIIPFYATWTDEASKTLLACDAEWENLHNKLNCLIDLTHVFSLRSHYEVRNANELTQKIRSIQSFKNINSPMKADENGRFSPDANSRYFIEDFPFGLCIIKGFCDIMQIMTPNIDRVLKWYETFSGSTYFTDEKFVGSDPARTGIPHNAGIYTSEDILRYYSR
jgi:hypothetical protein